jgi:fructose-bisphosphate aldolase class II
MIVTTAQLFKVDYGKFAVGAYNINNASPAPGPPATRVGNL